MNLIAIRVIVSGVPSVDSQQWANLARRRHGFAELSRQKS
jgi:hypothetical protein